MTQLRFDMRGVVILGVLLILSSCKSGKDLTHIEEQFGIEIPDCYQEIERPVIEYLSAGENIIELKFEEDCFEEFYDHISNPSSECRTHYVGANPSWDTNGNYHALATFVNKEESGLLILDPSRSILHYKKLSKVHIPPCPAQ